MNSINTLPLPQTQGQKEEKFPKIFSYTILFFLAFFFFLITTFPYDLLIEGFLQNYEKRLPPQIKPLVYESLEFDFPSSLILTGVQLGRTSSGTPLLKADSLTLNLGLLSAIRGKIALKYKASIYAGKLQGSYAGSPQKGLLKVNVKGLKIEESQAIQELLKLSASGKLNADINLSVSPLLNENRGKISFSIQDGKAKSVNLKVTTADFTFSEIQGDFSLEGGVLSINKFILMGDPANIELSGKITLNANDLKMSTLDIIVLFAPSPEFEKNVPFSLLEKVEEGKYKARLNGAFSQPILNR